MKSLLKLSVINLLVLLVLAELSLFVIALTAYVTHAPWAERIAVRTDKLITWEHAFLENHRKGKMVYLNLHQPHAERGWSMIPGKVVEKGGNTYTSNRQGFRSLYDFTNDERFQVMLLGDSFTFGDDADDKQIWPWLLQQKDSRLNILNMGGTGYGIDQMLLTLQEQLPLYSPDLVVVSFISDDLVRSTLSFRDYQKPRFTLNKNRELVLGNVPVPDVDTVVKRLENSGSTDVSSFRTYNLLHNLLASQQKEFNPMGLVRCDQECMALNTRLFERMYELSRERGAEFLLVYLPCCQEMVESGSHYEGHAFFHHYLQTHQHPSLDLHPVLTASDIEKHSGHYLLPEATIVSDVLYQTITGLPRWQTFLTAEENR